VQGISTRTEAQKASLRRLLADLHRRYPHARIVGHLDLNPQKACPCIADVAKEYADLQPKYRKSLKSLEVSGIFCIFATKYIIKPNL